MFKIKRLQHSFEQKLFEFFVNWKRTTYNFKQLKSKINFNQQSYQKEQEEVRKLLNQQEQKIYQSICKFKLNHKKNDQCDQMKIFSMLQLEVKLLATWGLKGELRDKINFNNRRSELLMEIYSALEEVQTKQNNIFIEYKLQQLEVKQNQQKILGLVKGQLSNQYIDIICKFYLHEEFWFALEQTYNEMLKQRIFNSNFIKLAKCLYIVKPNCQLYEIIIDLNGKSDHEHIEKIFHLKAIEIAIEEGYQHSLKFHLEQCLNHSWNQTQIKNLIQSSLKLSKRFEKRNQLYLQFQKMEKL